jgi:hypothetical protein
MVWQDKSLKNAKLRFRSLSLHPVAEPVEALSLSKRDLV